MTDDQKQDDQKQDDQKQGDQKQDSQKQGDQKQDSQGTKRIGDLDLKVPDEFKEEAWAKDIKTHEDVWKKLAGAQKLIGKKGIIPPGKDASKEEWDAHYKALGRPETPEGYEFKNIDALKEIERNPTLDNGIKQILHKYNVPKEAAEGIVRDYENLIYEFKKPELEKMTKTEKEFQNLTKEVLGSERDSTISAFKEIMRESLGDKAFLASKLEGLDNDALMPLIVFSKNLHDKYVGENKIKVNNNSVGDMTGDLRSDFQTLSQRKLALKLDKNVPEHIKAQRIEVINKQMMKLGEQAQEKNINLF